MRLIAWNIEVMYETCTHYKTILKKCMGYVIKSIFKWNRQLLIRIF